MTLHIPPCAPGAERSAAGRRPSCASSPSNEKRRPPEIDADALRLLTSIRGPATCASSAHDGARDAAVRRRSDSPRHLMLEDRRRGREHWRTDWTAPEPSDPRSTTARRRDRRAPTQPMSGARQEGTDRRARSDPAHAGPSAAATRAAPPRPSAWLAARWCCGSTTTGSRAAQIGRPRRSRTTRCSTIVDIGRIAGWPSGRNELKSCDLGGGIAVLEQLQEDTK